MSLLLLLVVAATMAVVAWRFSGSIFLMIGIVGFLAYSIPALLGIDVTVGIGRQRPVVADASIQSIGAMVLAWSGFLGLLLAAAVVRGGVRVSAQPRLKTSGGAPLPTTVFAWSALCLSLALFLFMSARNGFAFFLTSRAELSQSLGFDYLIWRWLNLFGLLFGITSKAKFPTLFFALMVIINMIIGDRTVITLALVAAFCTTVGSTDIWRLMRRPISWVYLASGVAVILFAKPFYMSLKDDTSLMAGLSTSLQQGVLAFEPFGTHYILDRVIAYDLHTSIWTVLKGSLAQLLIIPSLFGVDSSSFNAQITQQLYNSRLSYGIASNFWAQAYTLGGYACVVIYGALYGGVLLALQGWRRKDGSPITILVTAIAVLTGIYVHRNSVENYLSFVRQLVISFLLIAALAEVLLRVRTSRRPVTSTF